MDLGVPIYKIAKKHRMSFNRVKKLLRYGERLAKVDNIDSEVFANNLY